MLVWGTPVTVACVVRAAEKMRVPTPALVGLMATEDAHVGEVRHNVNGTVDMGAMQINSSWMPKLKQFHVTSYQLVYNGCLNVMVGAWVLRHYWDEVKDNPKRIWEAIGYYHSHNPELQQQYEDDVYERLANRATLTGVVAHANQWFCGAGCVAPRWADTRGNPGNDARGLRQSPVEPHRSGNH